MQPRDDARNTGTIDARSLLGSHDVLLVTFDALRYDVAVEALEAGLTPHLAELLPHRKWERRHTPGSFTYAAHQAFFTGFLPTPFEPTHHERLFALRFAGSKTTGPRTCVFDAPDIVSGFARAGYHTICIGGVGYFNKRTPLSRVLPDLFAESHWDESLGVTCRASPRNQFSLALERLNDLAAQRRAFLFVNLSAMHHPNRIYLDGATVDSRASQVAALAYVDREIGPFMRHVRRGRSWLCVFCSDHGTLYGDDGYHGHRIAHQAVWDVPYAEFVVPALGLAEDVAA
jgi:hypothetical protein